MIDGDIHALGITAKTPDESATENGRSAV
jgi:acid stress-induced BolA-like protein IbaG/YrbA